MAEQDADGALAVVDLVAPEGWKKTVGKFLGKLALGSRTANEFYQAGREAVSTAEGRAIVDRALAEAVVREVASDPSQIERAKTRFLRNRLSEQENIEAVLSKAEEKILSLPPPTSKTETQSIYEDEFIDIDPDWSTRFVKEAELATSDQMRERLASILSGEIRKPGTYPRSVFRTLVELEKMDIEAVYAAASVTWNEVSFLGLLGHTEGARVRDILQAADLLDSSKLAPHGITLEQRSDGLHLAAYARDEFGVCLQSTKPFLPMTGPSAVFSRAGLSALKIIDQDPKASQRNLAKNLEAEGTRTWLIQVTDRNGDMINFHALELISNKIDGPLTSIV